MPIQLFTQTNGESIKDRNFGDDLASDISPPAEVEAPRNVRLIKSTNQLRRLQTIIRDKYEALSFSRLYL